MASTIMSASPLLSWPLAALFLSLASLLTSSPSLLPSLRSAFHALHLSFITPPCLFLLLHAIIFVLALTSGLLKNSHPRGGSDFYSDFLMYVQDPSTQRRRLIVESPIKPSKPSKQLLQERSVTNQCNVNEEKRVIETALPLTQASESPAFHQKASEFCGLEIVGDEAVSGQSKSDVMEEAGSVDFVTPQCRRMPRSQSVGSAASVVKEDRYKKRSSSSGMIVFSEAPSHEDLSGEALRKRIEDFISKMNAQMRSESLQANKEPSF